MRRGPMGPNQRKTQQRIEEGYERPTRARTSDWRECGKGRNWPLNWVSEKDFQSHVESLAHQFGWKASHAHLPYFDTAGIPDLTLICIRPGKERALFAELKVRDKVKGQFRQPKGAQAEWIASMIKAGLDVRLWVWPDDDDAIYAELTR